MSNCVDIALATYHRDRLRLHSQPLAVGEGGPHSRKLHYARFVTAMGHLYHYEGHEGFTGSA
jgi:hypothetical protein